MTREWAATNTLRVPPGHAPACECRRCEEHAAALARVEAELSRLREERDALAEAQQFPVETVMSWKRQVDDAKRRSASALLLLDPERQDEPDEENALRAFEILSGLRPSTYVPDRERAEAAEARCAAMEECDCIPAPFSSKACPKCGRRGVVTETTVHSLMVEIRDEKARCARLQRALETIERDFPGDDDNWRWVTTLCREALAGPDTLTAGEPGVRPDGTVEGVAPSDGCAERQSTADPSPAASAGPNTPAIPPRPPMQPPGHQREMADTPADSQEDTA